MADIGESFWLRSPDVASNCKQTASVLLQQRLVDGEKQLGGSTSKQYQAVCQSISTRRMYKNKSFAPSFRRKRCTPRRQRVRNIDDTSEAAKGITKSGGEVEIADIKWGEGTNAAWTAYSKSGGSTDPLDPVAPARHFMQAAPERSPGQLSHQSFLMNY